MSQHLELSLLEKPRSWRVGPRDKNRQELTLSPSPAAPAAYQ